MNTILEYDDHAEVICYTYGQPNSREHSILTDDTVAVKIDKGDIPILGDHTWIVFNHMYIKSPNPHKKPTISFHRLLMKCPEKMVVHHINGDKLDNRKSNLKVMSSSDHSRLHARRPKRHTIDEIKFSAW